jgi:ubiquinone/menaquinone biosynthesis C-methylase UbiE
MAAPERAGLAERRRALLADVHGRVLELGSGTGLNLAHYPPAVTELVLTEPEEPMARRLEARLAECAIAARVVRCPAEELPFEPDSFDFVVCTLVLCTVADQSRVLDEVRRVLRAEGELRFLEHVRSETEGLARWQDRFAPAWVRIGHGCHCNIDTLANIRSARFDVTGVEHGALAKAAPIVRPLITGTAVPVRRAQPRAEASS